MSAGRLSISVVVPVYRTAWALPELVRRIDALAAEHDWRHEIVLVDDASPDDAAGAAGALAAGRAAGEGAIHLLPLPRNVGQHRAVLAGIEAATGDWVVVMDGDLQDPPEAIPALLDRALTREAGESPRFDAVFAARVNEYQSWPRMATSRLFKRVLARLCGLPEGSGMFFVASRRLAHRLRTDDPRPFVVAMVGLAGLPVSSVPVERAGRAAGRSAYSSWRRLAAGVSALAFVRRHRRRGARAGRAAPEPARPGAAAIAAGAGLLALLLSVAAGLDRPFDLGDEGFRYLLSRAWADGTDLFETYRLHYVPGQYVWFGAFLALFGPGLAVLRVAEALLGAAAVAAVAWTVARAAPRGLAITAGLAAACLATANHATLASALVFLAALGLARWWSLRSEREPVPSGRWVVAVAALAGLLAGWREDSAVLALAVACVAAGLRRRPGDLVRRVLPGALAGFAPWLAIFAVRGQADGLLGHVGHRLVFLVERLAAPLGGGWRPPEDPFASSWDLASALFPLLAAVPVAVYLTVLAWQAVRARRGAPVAWTAVAAALVGAAYLPQFLWERPDLPHLRAHLHLLVGAIGVAAAAGGRRLRRAATAGLVALAVLGLAYAAGREPASEAVPYPCCEGVRIGARLPAPPPWAGLDDRFLVLGWGPGWYTLEGQAPPTRFLYTGRRALRSPHQAAELAADLEDPAVRWLLVGPDPVPDAPGVEARARELYAPAARWREWQLWERR